MVPTDLDEHAVDAIKEVAKEVAKDVYADAGKPVMQPTGELVGLVPRAIKAALAPVEKWVLQREYNVAETKKLLEEKLDKVSPELIESPEPYIAVPALQYISYCMDNDELRDMYANLLANSMNKVVKNGVHPGFVEIIKQLCPDEAKILKYMSGSGRSTVPTITLRCENENGSGVDYVKNFSNVGELCNCEKAKDVNVYFDNLIRLGLLKSADEMASLTDKTHYEVLKNHPFILEKSAVVKSQKDEYNKPIIEESFVYLTDYGKAFCRICITSPTNGV